jgi:hypothetical protein
VVVANPRQIRDFAEAVDEHLCLKPARGNVSFPALVCLPKAQEKKMKRFLVVAASVAALVAASTGGALAGEVKGPPGTLNNTNGTGVGDHANSACAFSGLNDHDLSDPEGQNVNQTQTAADSWKFYGLPKGSPGTLGLCKGGSN